MEENVHFHAPAALPPKVKATRSYCIRILVGPRTVLNGKEKRFLGRSALRISSKYAKNKFMDRDY
jgi:hypothetical protein